MTVMTIAALHAAMKTMILLSRRIRDSDCGWGGDKEDDSCEESGDGPSMRSMDETMIAMCPSRRTKSYTGPSHDRDYRETARGPLPSCGRIPTADQCGARRITVGDRGRRSDRVGTRRTRNFQERGLQPFGVHAGVAQAPAPVARGRA